MTLQENAGKLQEAVHDLKAAIWSNLKFLVGFFVGWIAAWLVAIIIAAVAPERLIS